MFDAIKDNLNDIEIEAISFKKYADITENINYKAIHEMHKENIKLGKQFIRSVDFSPLTQLPLD